MSQSEEKTSQLDSVWRKERLIGAHISIGKGIWTIQDGMDRIGADTCGIFLKNQRQFKFKLLEEEKIKKFRQAVKNTSILVPHGSYLINLASKVSAERGYACFIDDLRRCHDLGIKYYNIHPGADTERRGESALKMIAENINKAHKEVKNTVILLENMAGQGTTCGRTFEELAKIIDEVEDKERIGITLDTCHLFGAGYDIRRASGFERVMEEFDRIVGMKYLKAVHLNDSKCELGSRKDRHEEIGKGLIGIEAFRYVMNSKYFEGLPMILETPDSSKYGEEIKLLRSLIERSAN